MVENNILEKVNFPQDIKQFNISELNELAKEIRNVLIKKVSTTGGHFAPNLGMVEATIALHYVFNSPVDKIVFDVSHQCYTHKILTGRKSGFINPESYTKYSGYTTQDESEHDFFKVGHTSTSISLACGLAKARDLKKDKENIIAVIGDGSLSGGEAYEGLNNAAVLGSNFIIVVNDNEMSISENQGGLYTNLKLLRDTDGKAENNFFKSLGLEYVYIKDGHDIELLINTFSKVKDINKPIVVHMKTIKGKGYEDAEKNKESFHFVAPFDLETKKPKNEVTQETYTDITDKFLSEKASKDSKVIGISAGTPVFAGFSSYRKTHKDQFVDVGIAEEHAIALASGIASNGGKPVVSLGSSFIQRSYDQLSQDLAINNNSAVIIVNAGGISNSDVTHLGIFDIPLISNIPNIVYLAPTCKEEYLLMLDWAIDQQDYPVAIRIPGKEVIYSNEFTEKNYSEINKFKVTNKGEDVAILGLGAFYNLAKSVAEELKNTLNINATVINPRFITGIDEELLNNLTNNHKVVVTLEDGVLDGGFGEKISRFYSNKNMKVLNYGAKKEFTDREPLEDLYKRYHLTKELIVNDIKSIM